MGRHHEHHPKVRRPVEGGHLIHTAKQPQVIDDSTQTIGIWIPCFANGLDNNAVTQPLLQSCNDLANQGEAISRVARPTIENDPPRARWISPQQVRLEKRSIDSWHKMYNVVRVASTVACDPFSVSYARESQAVCLLDCAIEGAGRVKVRLEVLNQIVLGLRRVVFGEQVRCGPQGADGSVRRREIRRAVLPPPIDDDDESQTGKIQGKRFAQS